MTNPLQARHLQLVNDMLELLEVDMRTEDDAEWTEKLKVIIGKGEPYANDFLRLLSKWAAYSTQGFAQSEGVESIDDALYAVRLTLMKWVESWS